MQQPILQHSKSSHLLSYSTAAAAFLAQAHDAGAQVVLTDLDPDVIIEAPNAMYDLDLNGDAITDFILSATSVGSTLATSLGASIFYGIHAAFIDPVNTNSVAASSAPGFAYPYVLASSVNVGAGQQFQNESFQTLAYSFFASNDAVVSPIHLYGAWLGGETDKFIGLKLNAGGNANYGWARLDVDASNKKIILKSYAYEQTPNVTIHTTLLVSVHETDNADFVSVYAFENSLYINLQSVGLIPATASLFDVTGNKLLYKQLLNQSEKLDISMLPPAVYILHVQSGENIFSSKLMIAR